jgi:hypothetical protein
VSRDAFSYDPQDTRDEPPRRAVRERSSTFADTHDDKTPSPDQRGGDEGIETRQQDANRVANHRVRITFAIAPISSATPKCIPSEKSAGSA